MDLSTFQLKIIDYAMEHIVPSLPEMPLKLFGFNIPLSPSLIKFGAGIGLTMSTFSLEKYENQLKMFGILDEDSNIDVDKLGKAMKSEIEKVQTIKVGNFEFDATDVDKFVTYLTT